MEKNFDIVFDSEKENGKSFQIANGLITILIAMASTTAGTAELSAITMLFFVVLNSFLRKEVWTASCCSPFLLKKIL